MIMKRSIEDVRRDFPVLGQRVHNSPLIYLDNAASLQVPLPVLNRLRDHYLIDHANVYRGAHTLSQRVSAQVDGARKRLADFFGAERPESIVFTSGTTTSINLAAHSYLAGRLEQGDAVVVTCMEHHSNLLPWQRLCRARGAELRVVPAPNGALDLKALRSLLDRRVKLVAVCAISNVLGSINPVAEIADLAHTVDAAILVDGAQAVRHGRWDLSAAGIDFFCCSGHKMSAPAGTGILYIRPDRFEDMVPVFLGGGMVDRVELEESTFAPMPHCLEAGTPDIGGILALAAAADYLDDLGLEMLCAREDALTAQLEDVLSAVEGIHILGSPPLRAGVVSVTADGLSPADLASIMDKHGVALRAGSQCAQPLLRSLGLKSVLRFSTAFYNTNTELMEAGRALADSVAFLRRWS